MSHTPVLIATVALAALFAERGGLLAMRVARGTSFMDQPGGHKAHGMSTPYLGGVAVLLALLAAVDLASSAAIVHLLVILLCAVLLAIVGTIDDRLTVSPYWRLLAEAIAAVAVWASHLGFTVFDSGALNLVLTVVWVIGVVNAFNLFDNLDGACASMACVSATGAGVLGLLHAEWHLAVLGFAIAGSCGGFLRHNLAAPARIFLGDGGSMPLGFLIACLAMATTGGRGLGATELLECGLLAGLPVLDTTLVVISRRRRGASVLTGGRDHLTHRLLTRLHAPWRVALVLAAVQAALGALALIGDAYGPGALIAFGFVAIALGVIAIAVLESPSWAPSAAADVLQQDAPARALAAAGHVGNGKLVRDGGLAAAGHTGSRKLIRGGGLAEPAGLSMQAGPGASVDFV